MKRLLVITALIAGPILYAQQKPSAANLDKAEFLKSEQTKTSPTTAEKTSLSDSKKASKKASVKNTEAKTTPNKKNIKAESFNEVIGN